MSKTPLLATGLKGLVGSRLVSDFADKYDFVGLDISDPEQPVDITQLDQVRQVMANTSAEFLVHFAAFTDVTKAWEQKDDKNGLAYQVNVVGTQNIVQACQEYDKHLIHISTAYVFDGQNPEPYTEEDQPHPIEWYGQTKLWAEEKVRSSSARWTILRIDQPFRSDAFPKQDIAHRIIAGLQSGQLYPQFDDHFFGPTFINDFAQVIDWVIRSQTTGLFHASSGEMWSDYEFSLAINEILALGKEVKRGKLSEYLKTLNRPYQKNTALNCQKLAAVIDFPLTPIKTALQQLKND